MKRYPDLNMQFGQSFVVADPRHPGLTSMIDWVSDAHSVPGRELKLRALLQLPRLADANGSVDWNDALAEVKGLAVDMPHNDEWFPSRDLPSVDVTSLDLRDVDETTAAYICTRFHHLKHHEPGARYLGMFRQGLTSPLALFVVRKAADKQDFGGRSIAAWDLVRVFRFQDAPRSTVRRGLSSVGRVLAAAEPICLRAQVNPNLGTDGTLYESGNWLQLASEPLESYTYVDGEYAPEGTAASLVERRAIQNATRRKSEDIVVTTSTMSLLPTRTYGQVFGANQRAFRPPFRTVRDRSQAPILLFDGDDVLWHTQPLFDEARAEAAQLIANEGLDVEAWLRNLLRLQLDYVETMGYAKERFPRACVQAYRCVARGAPDREVEATLGWVANQVFSRPATLIATAKTVVEQLRPEYRLAYVVQGDPGVQRARFASSGLQDYFDIIDIRQRRSTADIAQFVNTYPAMRHVLVGNSAPLDIAPAVEAGIEAVLIPAHSWEHESGAIPRSRRVTILGDLEELLTVA